MSLEALLKKYQAVQYVIGRYYYCSLDSRPWILDFTTPFLLIVEEESFFEKAWTKLIKDLAVYLQQKYPKTKQELLEFRTEWSKASIYSEIKSFTNMVELEPTLYLSVNYTALHSAWFVQDLLDFYSIDKNDCLLIVHKPPKAEPMEIQIALEESVIEDFKMYLQHKGLDMEKSERIVKGLKAVNRIMAKTNYSYNNFFLFDNINFFSTYKSKFMQEKEKYALLTEKQKNAIRRYLDYLAGYFINKRNIWEATHLLCNEDLTFTKPNGKIVKTTVIDILEEDENI